MTAATGRPKGFAALSPERRAEFARMGGKAAHAKGTAYKWNAETARIAGAKGGAATAARHGYVQPSEIPAE
jgi:general stress protein YciG